MLTLGSPKSGRQTVSVTDLVRDRMYQCLSRSSCAGFLTLPLPEDIRAETSTSSVLAKSEALLDSGRSTTALETVTGHVLLPQDLTRRRRRGQCRRRGSHRRTATGPLRQPLPAAGDRQNGAILAVIDTLDSYRCGRFVFSRL